MDARELDLLHKKSQILYRSLLCKQMDLLAAYLAGIFAGGKPIFLFGSGSVGCFLQAFFSCLRVNGKPVQIAGFLDNNPERQGNSLQGFFIHSPAVLQTQNPVVAGVVIATEYVASMARQLDGYGLHPLTDYWDGYYLYRELRRLVKGYTGEGAEDIPAELLKDLQHILDTRYFVGNMAVNPLLLARNDYQEWKRYYRLTIQERQELQASCRCLSASARVEFMIAVDITAAEWPVVARCVEALEQQVYSFWKVVLVGTIADDLGNIARLPEELREKVSMAATDQRGIGGLLSGKDRYVIPLVVEDRLAPEALYAYALAIQLHEYPQLLYCDEDYLDDSGNSVQPFFKPDWSPHSALSYDYMGSRGICIKSEWLLEQQDMPAVSQLGLFFVSMFRNSNLTTVCHVPQVLVHKRERQDIAFITEKILFNEIAARETALAGTGTPEQRHTILHVCYPLQGQPKISILIPTRDKAEYLSVCLQSIFAKTSYRNYEVMVIDNGSTEEATFALFQEWQHKEKERFAVIRVEEPFNYSRLNNWAVQKASGGLVVLLNNDTEVITADWLQDMAGYAQRPEVGAVGSMLLYADGTVQHAGVIIGVGVVADHAFRGFPADDPGYFGRLKMVADYSAVTGACLMVRKDLYQAVGGMEEALAVSYNDVDFCLKLREQGLYNVVLPFVRLYHYESKSRGSNNTPEKIAQAKREEQFMHEKWGNLLKNDPFYSPHLTRESTDFAIRMPDVWDVDE